MKRLAFVLMTGVGIYLHREWQKHKQSQKPSETTMEQAEKLLYKNFKEFESLGYDLSESRTSNNYYLRLGKKGVGLALSLRSGPRLKCLIIRLDDPKLIELSDFLKEKGYASMARKDFDTFGGYLKAVKNVLKKEL